MWKEPCGTVLTMAGQTPSSAMHLQPTGLEEGVCTSRIDEGEGNCGIALPREQVCLMHRLLVPFSNKSSVHRLQPFHPYGQGHPCWNFLIFPCKSQFHVFCTSLCHCLFSSIHLGVGCVPRVRRALHLCYSISLLNPVVMFASFRAPR